MTNSEEMRTRLHAALHFHFDGADLFKALEIWKLDFSKRSHFSQRQFALSVCNKIQSKSSYVQILNSITEAMEAELSSLPRPPSAKGILKDDEELHPARSFSALLSIVGKALNQPPGSDTLQHIVSLLLENGFSAALAAAVLRNLTAGENHTLIRFNNTDNYNKALNLIYVAACDLLGPKHADQLLSDSVKKTNRTRFGTNYSANNFL